MTKRSIAPYPSLHDHSIDIAANMPPAKQRSGLAARDAVAQAYAYTTAMLETTTNHKAGLPSAASVLARIAEHLRKAYDGICAYEMIITGSNEVQDCDKCGVATAATPQAYAKTCRWCGERLSSRGNRRSG